MATTNDDARAGAIQRRVVDWVNAALAASRTADGVGVSAQAVRAASLPDAGLEVRPEDWNVEVTLRFSDADGAGSTDVLAAIGEAGGTVTLVGGEAAEIEWSSNGRDLRADEVTDEPVDKPFQCVVPVHVSVPWPTRNDAAAGPA